MSVLPKKLSDLIAFCQARSTLWRDVADDIGLDEAQVLQWQGLIAGAQGKFTARTIAVANAKSATEALGAAGQDLRRKSAELVRSIKTFAEAQQKPSEVYVLANIPAPQNPSTMPPPGIPNTFKAALNPDGSLTISWKCANPPGASGTVYAIRRRSSASAAWEFIGAVGVRKFTDHALPPVTSITYQVQAQRGSSVGLPSTPFNVMFGSGGTGDVVITGQFEDDPEAPGDTADVRIAA